MHGLYLITASVNFLENQKKGLCLISAFIQGLYPNSKDQHLTESLLTEEIVSAMSFVIANKKPFSDLDTISEEIVSTCNEQLIQHVSNKNGLHPGEFWNIEILEKYISLASIPVDLYYYVEVFVIDTICTIF